MNINNKLFLLLTFNSNSNKTYGKEKESKFNIFNKISNLSTVTKVIGGGIGAIATVFTINKVIINNKSDNKPEEEKKDPIKKPEEEKKNPAEKEKEKDPIKKPEEINNNPIENKNPINNNPIKEDRREDPIKNPIGNKNPINNNPANNQFYKNLKQSDFYQKQCLELLKQFNPTVDNNTAQKLINKLNKIEIFKDDGFYGLLKKGKDVSNIYDNLDEESTKYITKELTNRINNISNAKDSISLEIKEIEENRLEINGNNICINIINDFLPEVDYILDKIKNIINSTYLMGFLINQQQIRNDIKYIESIFQNILSRELITEIEKNHELLNFNADTQFTFKIQKRGIKEMLGPNIVLELDKNYLENLKNINNQLENKKTGPKKTHYNKIVEKCDEVKKDIVEKFNKSIEVIKNKSNEVIEFISNIVYKSNKVKEIIVEKYDGDKELKKEYFNLLKEFDYDLKLDYDLKFDYDLKNDEEEALIKKLHKIEEFREDTFGIKIIDISNTNEKNKNLKCINNKLKIRIEDIKEKIKNIENEVANFTKDYQKLIKEESSNCIINELFKKNDLIKIEEVINNKKLISFLDNEKKVNDMKNKFKSIFNEELKTEIEKNHELLKDFGIEEEFTFEVQKEAIKKVLGDNVILELDKNYLENLREINKKLEIANRNKELKEVNFNLLKKFDSNLQKEAEQELLNRLHEKEKFTKSFYFFWKKDRNININDEEIEKQNENLVKINNELQIRIEKINNKTNNIHNKLVTFKESYRELTKDISKPIINNFFDIYIDNIEKISKDVNLINLIENEDKINENFSLIKDILKENFHIELKIIKDKNNIEIILLEKEKKSIKTKLFNTVINFISPKKNSIYEEIEKNHELLKDFGIEEEFTFEVQKEAIKKVLGDNVILELDKNYLENLREINKKLEIANKNKKLKEEYFNLLQQFDSNLQKGAEQELLNRLHEKEKFTKSFYFFWKKDRNININDEEIEKQNENLVKINNELQIRIKTINDGIKECKNFIESEFNILTKGISENIINSIINNQKEEIHKMMDEKNLLTFLTKKEDIYKHINKINEIKGEIVTNHNLLIYFGLDENQEFNFKTQKTKISEILKEDIKLSYSYLNDLKTINNKLKNQEINIIKKVIVEFLGDADRNIIEENFNLLKKIDSSLEHKDFTFEKQEKLLIDFDKNYKNPMDYNRFTINNLNDFKNKYILHIKEINITLNKKLEEYTKEQNNFNNDFQELDNNIEIKKNSINNTNYIILDLFYENIFDFFENIKIKKEEIIDLKSFQEFKQSYNKAIKDLKDNFNDFNNNYNNLEKEIEKNNNLLIYFGLEEENQFTFEVQENKINKILINNVTKLALDKNYLTNLIKINEDISVYMVNIKKNLLKDLEAYRNNTYLIIDKEYNDLQKDKINNKIYIKNIEQEKEEFEKKYSEYNKNIDNFKTLEICKIKFPKFSFKPTILIKKQVNTIIVENKNYRLNELINTQIENLKNNNNQLKIDESISENETIYKSFEEKPSEDESIYYSMGSSFNYVSLENNSLSDIIVENQNLSQYVANDSLEKLLNSSFDGKEEYETNKEIQEIDEEFDDNFLYEGLEINDISIYCKDTDFSEINESMIEKIEETSDYINTHIEKNKKYYLDELNDIKINLKYNSIDTEIEEIKKQIEQETHLKAFDFYKKHINNIKELKNVLETNLNLLKKYNLVNKEVVTFESQKKISEELFFFEFTSGKFMWDEYTSYINMCLTNINNAIFLKRFNNSLLLLIKDSPHELFELRTKNEINKLLNASVSREDNLYRISNILEYEKQKNIDSLMAIINCFKKINTLLEDESNIKYNQNLSEGIFNSICNNLYDNIFENVSFLLQDQKAKSNLKNFINNRKTNKIKTIEKEIKENYNFINHNFKFENGDIGQKEYFFNNNNSNLIKNSIIKIEKIITDINITLLKNENFNELKTKLKETNDELANKKELSKYVQKNKFILEILNISYIKNSDIIEIINLLNKHEYYNHKYFTNVKVVKNFIGYIKNPNNKDKIKPAITKLKNNLSKMNDWFFVSYEIY